MEVKYLGFADSHEFSKEDLRQAGIERAKAVTFTQGEGSVQIVTKEVGEYLIANHAPLFAEVTDENRDVTNASDTRNVPITTVAGVGAVAPVAATGDTTTEGDVT